MHMGAFAKSGRCNVIVVISVWAWRSNDMNIYQPGCCFLTGIMGSVGSGVFLCVNLTFVSKI